MIYLFAGHNKRDPGTTGVDGITEAELAIELRDMIAAELADMGANFILDNDNETLTQLITRIKPGIASVLCDLHFNSAAQLATGTECLVADNAHQRSHSLALELQQTIISATGFFNRGVKTEKNSHRGRLGILHTAAGMAVLAEICFINNPKDLATYHKNKGVLAKRMAIVLKRHDDKI
jgi:N-acetylmuramoyl-L-alanine amidase